MLEKGLGNATSGFKPNTVDGRRAGGDFVRVWLCVCVLLSFSGCAALTNPVGNGIPAHLLPPELLAESKEDWTDVPLRSLQRHSAVSMTSRNCFRTETLWIDELP